MTFTAELVAIEKTANESQALNELLDNVRDFIRRYIVVTDHEFTVLSLWILHTYTFQVCDYTPYINITSPTPGAGKSQLLRVLRLLVNKPESADMFTTAALTRTIDKHQPTMLVDEMDAFFAGNKDRAETMRGILNGGFSKAGTVGLCEGAQHTLRKFRTFQKK